MAANTHPLMNPWQPNYAAMMGAPPPGPQTQKVPKEQMAKYGKYAGILGKNLTAGSGGALGAPAALNPMLALPVTAALSSGSNPYQHLLRKRKK